MIEERISFYGRVAAILGLLISPLAAGPQQTGSVSGTLKSHWLEKGYEMVVSIEKAPGETFPAPAARPKMNQINLVYAPHILPIVQGWEVEFHSEDKELHNLLARFKAVLTQKAFQLFNIAMPPGRPPLVKRFEKEGRVTLLCSIHKEMNAYILVLQNPYFAKVGKEGNFRIEGVPPGQYSLKVWGEKLRPEQLAKTFPVTVESGKASETTIAP